MYLISVYFDEQTNKILNRFIKQIAEKTGNDFMVRNNVPPHMTISSIEAKSAEVLLPAFETLSENLKTGQIQLAFTGQLHPYVFFAAPVLDAYLQGLMEQIFSVFKDIPETSISKFYQPYSWVPHVTLGKTLAREQMATAFEVMQEQFIPFEAKVTEIALSRVNPHEDVVRFPLK